MAVQPVQGRVSNIGAFETTEGTAVTANKQLQGTAVIPDLEAEVIVGGPQFSDGDTYSILAKEWTMVDVPETDISVPDLNYILECFAKGAATVTADGTNGQSRLYTESTSIKTMTAEFGDSNEADRAAGVFFNSLKINADRSKARMSATGMGRLMTVGGVTLAASPTLVQQMMVQPPLFAVRIADSLSGLGSASDEPAIYEAGFSVEGRWGVHWPMDPANTSYKGRVPLKPNREASLSIANDATGRALITTNLRTNVGKYFRITLPGPVIAGATPSQYKVVIEGFGFVKSAPKRKDFDNLIVLPVVLGLAKTATLSYYQITTITEQATL